MGGKGVVCGPEGARLADNHVPTKLKKSHLFYQVPYIHVHFMAPGQILRWLRRVGAQGESLTL
jgi:hypothetical protein